MSLTTESSSGLNNGFSDIPTVGISKLAQNDRVQPRNVPTGVTRGAWRINHTDGSYVIVGVQPDSRGFGIGFYNSSNVLVSLDEGKTAYRFRGDGTAYFISGELPDGTQGDVYSKSGIDVRNVFA